MKAGLALPLLLRSCGEAGVATFERSCRLEQEGSTLLIHYPDGGFRRLRIVPASVAATDGADPALVQALPDGRLEVTIARNRFRLPPGIAGP